MLHNSINVSFALVMNVDNLKKSIHNVILCKRQRLDDSQPLTIEGEKGFEMLIIQHMCCYSATQIVHALSALKLWRNVLKAGLVSFTGPGSQFVIKVIPWDGKILGLPGAVLAVTDRGIHSCIFTGYHVCYVSCITRCLHGRTS